ncbi:MAG: Abi family protein [Vagococcus sp.]|uniref:Abi family protein n=1 Tax=Vagococcus sp. TaxID=1933889 RepID=UPI002FC7B7EE
MKNIVDTHPYKSFEEQLIFLKNEKGLIIDNPNAALEELKTFSYYTLINGYKDIFLDKTITKKETFIKGTTFSMLYQVHWADLALGNIMFKYALTIEKKLKTQIAYLIAQKYSTLETNFIDRKNYSSAKEVNGFYSELKRGFAKAKRTDVSCLHYQNTHANIPPWILAKGISFGNILNWYKVLKPQDKKEIIEQTIGLCQSLNNEENLEFFKISIDQVYQYRNLTAHGNRTVALKLKSSHKYKYLKEKGAATYFLINNEYRHKNDLFSLMMTILLLTNDIYLANNFILDLEILFFKYKDEKFLDKDIYDVFKLPKDFIERLENYRNNKFDPSRTHFIN